MDAQLWRMEAGSPGGPVATGSAAKVVPVPKRETPSTRQALSDGPGHLDAGHLPDAHCAKDDVGSPGRRLRILGLLGDAPCDSGVSRGLNPRLAGIDGCKVIYKC